LSHTKETHHQQFLAHIQFAVLYLHGETGDPFFSSSEEEASCWTRGSIQRLPFGKSTTMVAGYYCGVGEIMLENDRVTD